MKKKTDKIEKMPSLLDRLNTFGIKIQTYKQGYATDNNLVIERAQISVNGYIIGVLDKTLINIEAAEKALGERKVDVLKEEEIKIPRTLKEFVETVKFVDKKG